MMHTVVVRNRRVAVVSGGAVADNYGTDVVDLRLDSAFDGCEAVLILGCGDSAVRQVWTGDPLPVPGSLMVEGDIPVSVVGFRDGVRIVTAAGASIHVERAGCYDGSDPAPDDPDMLQQLVQAAGDATDAADAANDAAKAANEAAHEVATASFSMGTVTTLEPGEQASASLDGEGLQKTLNLSIPKGAKGDKGDPGEKGDPGADGTNGQNGADGFSPTVEVSKSGTVTTISITDKTGVKTAEISDGAKGDKGETGDPGDKGEPGTAATIAVGSVTGLDAGASPTVVNSGTANAAILDFGIPKGDKGDPGDDGHTPQRGVDYWTAEDVEAVVEDAKTQAVAELAEIGNIPKKTVSDLVAHGEDTYAQKPIEVRVNGETWVNRWPYKKTSTVGGITVSMDSTGLMTVSGTATEEYITLGTAIGVAPNKTYTLVVSSLPANTIVHADSYSSENTWLSAISVRSGTTATGTTHADMSELRCMVRVTRGATVNASFRVMLVEGSEAPDCFTPPASITSVQTGNLVTAGKNLLDEDAPTADGVIGPQLPPGEYALSGTLPSGASLRLLNGGADGETITDASSLPHAFSSGHPFTPYYAGVGGYATGLMLELGSTATAYEPPNVTQTPLPEVELRSLPNGTCDELVIGADGTCEVKRRTQLVDGEIVALDTPTTEPQSPVTLPALPAPTFNAYHDSQVPSDTSLEYARDINLVLANLEAVQTALLGGE